MKTTAQTAVEYLLITSFLLVITGIIFAYSLFIYSDSVAQSTANSAVASIVNAVDQVYALGQGSTLFFEVDVPQNINNVQLIRLPPNCVTLNNCTKTALVLKLQTSGGVADIVKSAKGEFKFVIYGPYTDNNENDATLLALKRQGHYFLKAYWDPIQPAITVCLHEPDGTCQS